MAEEEGKSRRSQIVTYSIFGLLGAVWIGDWVIPSETEMRRNTYPDRAACERDYTPAQCEASGTSGTGSGTYYYGGGYQGPYYAASRSQATTGDPGSGRSGAVHASYTTSYRGGFGAFGHAVHAAA
jgi:hypothetical protein